MTNLWNFWYHLALSLWVGGISIFTFVITPAIFRSFERDMAGKIVGYLFPGYFAWNTVLSILALVLLFPVRPALSRFSVKLSLVLIVIAVIINVFVAVKLHPDIKKVKREIHSFEGPADASPLRKQFGKLHAVSASLNLLLLADGVALLFLSSIVKK